MPPRNIVHVITGLGTGGAEMMLLRLLTVTDRERWRPLVISLQGDGVLGKRFAAIDVPVHPLGLRSILQAPTALWKLRRALRSFRPTLVQGWMYHGNVAASIGQALIRQGDKVPVVWNIRYTPADLELEKRATAAVIRLGARLSSRPARIIYNSRAGATRHAQLGYAQGRAEVIPNGFDTDRFAPSAASRSAWRTRLGASDQTILIGRIARYHPMKDYPGFLKAAAMLFRARPDVRFVLAGQGVDSSNLELAQWLATLSIAHAVHLLGELPTTADLWPALDIACSSSAYGEAFPTVLGEAMACGVPCVTTAVGDSAWIVGDTGRVVPPADPSALAAGLEALIDEGAESRSRLGLNARARIIQDFSLASISSAYETKYREILGRVKQP